MIDGPKKVRRFFKETWSMDDITERIAPEDLIELSTCGHSVLNSLVVEYLGREGEDRFRYLGWVNDEKYWLREIVGVGERILPADCFGHPIDSKEE